MIKRTIEISTGPTYLHLKYGQMKLSRDGDELHSIPIEDIGVLVLSHPAISYTQGLFMELLDNNVAVLFCNHRHLPEGLLLPFQDNQIHSKRLRLQVNTTKPTKKRMWQQIVRAKIKSQAWLLIEKHGDDAGLQKLIPKVYSGDPKNVEARAARTYWKFLFPETDFRRRPEEGHLNSLLNYGYAVVRAAVARSLTAAGLHPSMGVHHHNKYNPYCLADDMMEPFRPFVDEIVFDIYIERETTKVQLVQSIKKELLRVLTMEVEVKDLGYPFLESLHLMAASAVKCFANEEKQLAIPKRP
jgi:CRISPR-associated protein Cas1